MTRFFALLALVPLLLAGCASSTKTGDDLASIVKAERGASLAPATCEVPAGLIGKPHTDLNTMKFKVPIRVIFPGTAVSGDHVSNRLNFKVDKKGIIKAITCG